MSATGDTNKTYIDISQEEQMKFRDTQKLLSEEEHLKWLEEFNNGYESVYYSYSEDYTEESK